LIKKQRRWDGKWRIVIFDIKEYKKGQRDQLREELIDETIVNVDKNGKVITPEDYAVIEKIHTDTEEKYFPNEKDTRDDQLDVSEAQTGAYPDVEDQNTDELEKSSASEKT